MTVRAITGNIADLAGVSIPNATFSVVPESYVFSSTETTVTFGDQTTVTADDEGGVSFSLHEGKYIGRISVTQGPKTFRLVVDSEGPWTLGRLIGELDPITSSLAAQVFDAVAAAEKAIGIARQVEVTASRNLELNDQGSLLYTDTSSAITLTIPTDASAGWDDTTVISIAQDGIGAVTIAAAAGVSLNGVTAGQTVTQGPWAAAQIIRRGADSWRVWGLVDEVTS